MDGNLLNVLWVLIASFLVFFMQLGFAMLETGFTRAKNAGNIIMKNIMDFAIGSIVFFAVGYAFMFGTDAGSIIGTSGFFDPMSTSSDTQGELPAGVFILFETMFCATAATIVSGAMAERTKFISYLICSAIMSLIIYPVTGHWIWGSGWLSNMGFHDFAGSSVVHMVGGICAFVGAWLVGPRIGKYTKKGKSVGIPGHNIPIAAIGAFILWFGWFGFNCGSELSVTEKLGEIALNTNLSAASGAVAAMILTWIIYKKPDVSMVFNGIVSGLVAITASCDVVKPWEAIVIGTVAGVLMTLSVDFIDKKVKIDDPVGAISVHCVCGLWGTIAAGIFGEGCSLSVQLVGVLAVFVYVFVTALILFGIVKKTIGLRVPEQTEIEGLDIHEHNSVAYGNFRLHDDR